MIIDEVHGLVKEYYTWLRDKTTLRQVGDWVEITTPYLDRHNDYLQIYARPQDGGYVLTDDGYVVQDLAQSGCRIAGGKRQALLDVTLKGFGVRLSDQALEVHASRENFALRKHNLLQAMLAVNDLFYVASPTVTSLFYEDVVAWLDVGDVRYTPRVKFTGRSGYDHLFDFVIPRSKAQPERLLKAINHPSRDSAEALAFAWVDTREVRSPESRAYAILNDAESPVPEGVLDAMRSYDVHPILWTGREQFREELAA
jgi:hypothetical protein